MSVVTICQLQVVRNDVETIYALTLDRWVISFKDCCPHKFLHTSFRRGGEREKKEKEREREGDRERERDRNTDRQTGRQTVRQTERKT